MTTTDIARMEDNAVAVLNGSSDALHRLGEWVTAARQAHELVAPLVETAFVPDAYRPKVNERASDKEKEAAYRVAVANATAAVLQGITLGLDPLTALQQIYIVHGRPGMYTEMKVAMLKSRGHEVWVEDLTDTRAVVCGRRAGTDYTERVTVTMDQARKAGWATKNDNYTKTPQDMLYARAAGRVCDRVAPDVLMGIASVEEIQDTIKATAETGDGTRTVTPRKRGPAAAVTATATAVEEPPLDEEPATSRPAAASPREPEPNLDGEEATAPPPSAEEKPPSITRAQTAKMKTLFADAGITDREAMRAYCTQQLGRVISSVSELSRDDADKVIDALTPAQEPPATLDEEAWLADQQPPEKTPEGAP